MGSFVRRLTFAGDARTLGARFIAPPYLIALATIGLVLIGGFCLPKDMAKGNQLGPCLVTPDAAGDPYNLKVTVLFNGQVKYQVRPTPDPNTDTIMKTPDSKHLLRAALLTALVAATVASPAANPSTTATSKRPNIVIILGDDLGFADMGCFGSEIKTPHLDSLAQAGVRCTQFYTSASCSPTRSMLLSGVDTHLNGLGNMDEWTAPNQWGVDGYEGYLNNRVATLPQLLKRQVELGIVPKGTELAERMWFIPDAALLAPASRAILGKKMELYAGMVENMDYHTGRLIDHLKKIGEYDNTIFIVFGDNGAEGADLFKMIAGTPGTRDFLFASMQWSQTHPNAWGDPHTYVGYGPMWAQVSMTPFSQYKGNMAEGGIRNALIVSGPIVKRPAGSINHSAIMHVADLMPTLLEVAGASYPQTINGHEPPPLLGKSWVKMLAGEEESPRSGQDYLAWEIFGNRAVRQGDWKLRWQYKPYGTEEWELFNLAEDAGERHDLAAAQPEKLKALVALWDDYVRANKVVLPNRVIWEGMAKKMPDRYPVVDGYPPLIYKRQFMPPTNMLANPKP